MATYTFRGSTDVKDGLPRTASTSQNWATKIAANGSDVITLFLYWEGASVGNNFARASCCVFIIDVTAIGDTETISSATMQMWGDLKQDSDSNTPSTNMYSQTSTVSETAVSAGDFQARGSTAYCDTAITYANFKTDSSTAMDFVVNAAGITAIDAKKASGKFKFCFRNVNYDVAATAPTNSGTFQTAVEFIDTSNATEAIRPLLTVVTSAAGGGSVFPNRRMLMGIG